MQPSTQNRFPGGAVYKNEMRNVSLMCNELRRQNKFSHYLISSVGFPFFPLSFPRWRRDVTFLRHPQILFICVVCLDVEINIGRLIFKILAP